MLALPDVGVANNQVLEIFERLNHRYHVKMQKLKRNLFRSRFNPCGAKYVSMAAYSSNRAKLTQSSSHQYQQLIFDHVKAGAKFTEESVLSQKVNEMFINLRGHRRIRDKLKWIIQ